ncbi:hypothetical protein [Streptomyces sp. NPDC059894]|uniref:hypothetical protein n=1 Tax=unclassified Streptomyces TaxID=2593676 RepID=UPI003661A793
MIDDGSELYAVVRDSALSDDREREQVAVADYRTRHRQDSLDLLVSHDGRAGGDPPDERDLRDADLGRRGVPALRQPGRIPAPA